jgi:site-specific DNA recombinase
VAEPSDQLLANALDFIHRAANDLWDEGLTAEQQSKYSTIELYEAVELVLKARLMEKHWSLTLRDQDRYKRGSFELGDFISVTLDAARTQLMWRPGRIRNLVVNPCYKGEYQYGRRSEKGPDVIKATMPALVREELWNAAQQTLALHRIQATSESRRGYLLRGVLRCGICGLAYCGANGKKGAYWYRCNGQLVERGPIDGKCLGKSLRGDEIERIVWADVEAWLRDPGDLLDELEADTERIVRNVDAENEGTTLEELEVGRKRAIALHVRGTLSEDELDQMLDDFAKQRRAVEDRLAAPSPAENPEEPPVPADLPTELRTRLDEGLDFATRQEIVRILVRRVLVAHDDRRGWQEGGSRCRRVPLP